MNSATAGVKSLPLSLVGEVLFWRFALLAPLCGQRNRARLTWHTSESLL